jgi:hypothetical protein
MQEAKLLARESKKIAEDGIKYYLYGKMEIC